MAAIKEEHPGLLLINNMHTASKVRDAIKDMLRKLKPKRLNDYKVVVDFTMPVDQFIYAYNLRVYPVDSRTPVLSIWSETRDGLVSDENMAKLLILYNS